MMARLESVTAASPFDFLTQRRNTPTPFCCAGTTRTSAVAEAVDAAVRLRAFAFLTDLKQVYGDSPLPRAPLEKGFEFEGVRVPFLGVPQTTDARMRAMAEELHVPALQRRWDT